MGRLIGIVGPSGSGKSTSLGSIKQLNHIGLDSEETLLVNVMGKPLPFKKGAGNAYSKETKNIVKTRDAEKILTILNKADKRTEIKNVVIDDFQYIMSGEFMDKAKKTGFAKFTEIADHVWKILDLVPNLRDDLNVFVLTHDEILSIDGEPQRKIKTIGKLLDEKITLEGLFTILLFTHSEIESGKVKKYFITNDSSASQSKSPIGMFENRYIPNDLGYVLKQVNEYYN